MDDNYYFPGIDYYNGRTRDFANVRKFEESSLDPNKESRLPWFNLILFLYIFIKLFIFNKSQA